jgi:lysophospholipase L1-like esterase
MADLNLKSFDKLYPMIIHKYKDLIPDNDATILEKINSIIDYLNKVGKLTNDVVKDWNVVYQWVMNDGLTTDVKNKIDEMTANGYFDGLIQSLVPITTEVITARNTYSSLDNRLDGMDLNISGNTANITSNSNIINTQQLRQNTTMNLVPLFNGLSDFTCLGYNDAVYKDWTFSDTELIPVLDTSTTNGGTKIFHKTLKLQDGEVGVTLKGQDLTQTYTLFYGIIFRATSQKEYYLAAINNNTLQAGLYKITAGGTLTVIQTASLSSNTQALYKNGQPINLSVEFIGQSVYVKVNGSIVVTSTATTLNDTNVGYIGLAYISSAGMSTLVPLKFSDFWYREKKFDNIKGSISKVLAVGDSITFGTGASVQANAWVDKLRTQLKTLNPNAIVDNKGTGGNNTAFVLVNQVQPFVNGGYDLMLIQAGTNDCRIDGTHLTIDQSMSNMRSMVKLAKYYGVIPIVCTITPVNRALNTTTYTETSWAQLIEYNNRVRAMCAKEKIKCCDNFNALNNDLTQLISDGIHPNDGGHTILYNEMWKTLTN